MAKINGRVCLVYGVQDVEEVSRLTLQLAREAALQTDREVLVVDGEFETRRLSVLAGADDDALEARPLDEIDERLHYLPLGESESDEAFLRRIEFDLHRCAEHNTLVLIDGGSGENPLLPQLAALCDAALLHVPLGTVSSEVAQAALKKLHSWGVAVLGTVVTGVRPDEAWQAMAEPELVA